MGCVMQERERGREGYVSFANVEGLRVSVESETSQGDESDQRCLR